LRRSNIEPDLSNPRFVSLEGSNTEANRTRLRVGDILISITADIGIIGYVGEDFPTPSYINQHIARVRFTDDAVSSKFIAYYLSSWMPQRRFVGSTDTGAKAGLNLATVGSLMTAVPSIGEQLQIAEALGDIDYQIASFERLVLKKRAFRQGLMQQLLTGKTRLPGFVKPWSTVRLGDHVTYVKTVALSRAQLDSDSPLRYVHYGDIHTSAEVVLAAAEAPMPRAASSLVRSAGRLQVGDVIFADASEDPAGVGKSIEITSVPPEGVVPGLHTIAARFNKCVLADGFKAYLQFIPEFRKALLRLAAGTKVLATSRSYISSISLELPEVDEQLEIAQALRDSDDEIGVLNHRLTKAMAVKQGMMQELLTGRTRLQSKRAQHE
jgi:type I restriction enzyme S subunit